MEGGVSLATSESREGQVERKETPIAATTTVLYGVSRERERERCKTRKMEALKLCGVKKVTRDMRYPEKSAVIGLSGM